MHVSSQRFQSECPHYMVKHRFSQCWTIDSSAMENIWNTLQTREFFVDGQMPPYKVEFDSPLQKGAFEEGELHIHHGPLLSLHGSVGAITPTTRELFYFYGSYAISFRLVRPYYLYMHRDQDTLTIALDTYVKTWFLPIWKAGNHIFWSSFGMWIRKQGIEK